MNPDLWRTIETLASLIFGGTFLMFIGKIVFAAGSLVTGQQQLTVQVKDLTTQVKDAATAFEKFAESITRDLGETKNHVNGLEIEVGIIREVYPIGGRRATDKPLER